MSTTEGKTRAASIEENAIDVEKTRAALQSFKPIVIPTLTRAANAECLKSTNPTIDAYFAYVAKTGRPLFQWDLIRPVFLWKLQMAMLEMQNIEAEAMTENADADSLFGDAELKLGQRRILDVAAELTGSPFTIQRLCELLVAPARHYKRTEKFYRALEKTINVVTSVTENGDRVTGVDDDDFAAALGDPRVQNFEQRLLKVDELDEGPQSMQQSFENKENNHHLISRVEGSPISIDPPRSPVLAAPSSSIHAESRSFTPPKANANDDNVDSMDVDEKNEIVNPIASPVKDGSIDSQSLG